MKSSLGAGLIGVLTGLILSLSGGAGPVCAAGSSSSASAPGPASPAAVSAAAVARLSSGPGRVALIELFTSEGCSSCPPAEQWLSGLRSQPGLWRDFVPVSYHVDYWDRLGWRDRFATRAFTARQYAVARAWGGGSVYTPCFVRNGEEWRPRGRATEAAEAEAGMLVVEVGGDGVCRVEFSPAEPGSPAGYEVHLAVLGGGYVSRVTAGENRGATLTHDFVALGVVESALVAEPSGRSWRAQVRRPALGERVAAGAERMAITAWVTRPGEFAVLQAAGGWIRL
jgi:hypothetical protein